MTATLLQRSRGHGRITAGAVDGAMRVSGLRQEGSARIGLPRHSGGVQAVLINTSGGMTSGDRLLWEAEAGAGACLTLTTQACERIYRCTGGPAETTVRLTAGPGARLAWLPQETLLFQDADYRRRIEVDLAPDAEFLLVEPMLFGRLHMGERPQRIALSDDWRIRRAGAPVHAEAVRLATDDAQEALEGMAAFATVVFISARSAGILPQLRRIIGQCGGASLVGARLVCRLAAPDGYELRKRLVPLIAALHFDRDVPRLWML